MKKVVSICLFLCLLLSMSACGESQVPAQPESPAVEAEAQMESAAQTEEDYLYPEGQVLQSVFTHPERGKRNGLAMAQQDMTLYYSDGHKIYSMPVDGDSSGVRVLCDVVKQDPFESRVCDLQVVGDFIFYSDGDTVYVAKMDISPYYGTEEFTPRVCVDDQVDEIFSTYAVRALDQDLEFYYMCTYEKQVSASRYQTYCELWETEGGELLQSFEMEDNEFYSLCAYNSEYMLIKYDKAYGDGDKVYAIPFDDPTVLIDVSDKLDASFLYYNASDEGFYGRPNSSYTQGGQIYFYPNDTFEPMLVVSDAFPGDGDEYDDRHNYTFYATGSCSMGFCDNIAYFTVADAHGPHRLQIMDMNTGEVTDMAADLAVNVFCPKNDHHLYYSLQSSNTEIGGFYRVDINTREFENMNDCLTD